MGIYAGLGVGQAVFFFCMGSGFAMLTYIASKKLHNVSSHSRRRTSLLTKRLMSAILGRADKSNVCADVILRDYSELMKMCDASATS